MKMKTSPIFLILTALALVAFTVTIGCGEDVNPLNDGILVEDEALVEESQEEPEEEPEVDDGISWGSARDDETPPVAVIPTISLVKTQISRPGEVETLFQVETDQRLHDNLVVALEICHTDARVEHAILVLPSRQAISEKISFGKSILQVKLLSYETILKLDPQMKPINSRVGRVDLTKYPIQERRYKVNPKGKQVSK